jgi:hypothetical protein
MADLAAAESVPSSTPAGFDQIMKQLGAYACLAIALVGEECEH